MNLNRRIVYDVETTGLLNAKTIDYTKFPYRLKPGYRTHCLVVIDVDTEEVFRFYLDTLKDLVSFFENEVGTVIGHNIINFDNVALRLTHGLHFSVMKSTLNGRKIKIIDTLVMSRMLNPDRKGGHSLKEWGKRTGIFKDSFGETTDWSEFSMKMLDYCEQDCWATLATFKALVAEWGDWNWNDAFDLEQKVAELTTIQEHFGFYFNSKLANECVTELNQWLEEIAQDVEPRLPEKKMGKTRGKDFIPPKIQFTKAGKPSANLEKFLAKHDGKFVGERQVELFGKVWDLPLPLEPLLKTEPMTLAHQADLKYWLVEAGWVPQVFNEKDLTLDSKKRKLTPEKFRASVLRYIEETLGSPYEEYRCERVKCKPYELKKKLLNHDMKKPLKVYTAPKYTINQDKDIDPNLSKLGEKYSFVADVVRWLTYRHRRNSILSPNGTGFLHHVREDNRIPTPANPCGASTSRYQHNVVCNVPRVTSLYGDKMRDLFGAQPGYYQLGYDASGLEARVEGHYTMQFPGGKEYAVDLIAEKPNDIHTKHAKINNITRDEQKTLKYSISYGAQPPKIAKQMGWPMSRAQKTFESFWQAAFPLKVLKERVIKYWHQKGGKKFVKAVDGRKLFVRSEHSIINMVFQSAGVICCKRANVMHHERLEAEGLLFDPFEDVSMEGKTHSMIHYHDEAQWQVCKSLVDVFTFATEKEAQEFSLEGKPLGDVHEHEGEYIRMYSRVGELAKLSMRDAGEYYGLRVKLDSDYIIGQSWKDCH